MQNATTYKKNAIGVCLVFLYIYSDILHFNWRNVYSCSPNSHFGTRLQC